MMDSKKLQEIATALNTAMVEEGLLSELSVKTIWERLMSCIAQGKEEEVKLAFPIRMELQNRITKLLPSKLDAFRNHVQDLDDEMNKMLPCPDMSLTNESKDTKETESGRNETETEPKETETGQRKTETGLKETEIGQKEIERRHPEKEIKSKEKTRPNTAESSKSVTSRQSKSEPLEADAISVRDELADKESQIKVLAEKIHELETKILSRENLSPTTCDKNVGTDSNNETDHDKEIEILRKQVKGRDVELKRCSAEIDHLQHRLSAFSSAALSDGSETISDLSDPNRPVKLGERYSELYDNEWTDGFEILTTELQYTDTEAIKKLTEILYDAYSFCEMSAQKHLRDVTERLIFPFESELTSDKDTGKEIGLGALASKTLKDLRRSTGKDSLPQVQTMFKIQKNKPDTYTDDILSNLDPYILKCVELCWLVVVQTPPVYINTQLKTIPGEPFNNDLFKFYSDTGDKMDYLVWPPLFLKEGGPVLCKGVAQPRGIL